MAEALVGQKNMLIIYSPGVVQLKGVHEDLFRRSQKSVVASKDSAKFALFVEERCRLILIPIHRIVLKDVETVILFSVTLDGHMTTCKMEYSV